MQGHNDKKAGGEKVGGRAPRKGRNGMDVRPIHSLPRPAIERGKRKRGGRKEEG